MTSKNAYHHIAIKNIFHYIKTFKSLDAAKIKSAQYAIDTYVHLKEYIKEHLDGYGAKYSLLFLHQLTSHHMDNAF